MAPSSGSAEWYPLDTANRCSLEGFLPYQTCHRRFQQWVRMGVMGEILRTLAKDLKERGGLDLADCFIDGPFVVAKKGASGWDVTKRGKGHEAHGNGFTALVLLSPYPSQVLARMR